MLEALKFVQGAVAKKDLVQALTHFCIVDGRIKGYNGNLALCSPIDLNLNAAPRAIPFVKAIQTCKETVQLNLTSSGRLSVKSGKFRAYIECTEEPYPDIEPEGTKIELKDGFLDVLKRLNPFIGEDASRQWSRGILFRGPSAFATNNVVLVEYWLGFNFPVEVNIPKTAIQELIRVGLEPTHLQVCDSSVTFHYKGDRWLRTQTYSTQWPDLTPVLDRAAETTKLPENFFLLLSDLGQFSDELDRLFFLEGRIGTSQDTQDGAFYDVAGLPDRGIFNLKQFQKLETIVDTIDLTLYPTPCLFFGDRIRGAIVGMRP